MKKKICFVILSRANYGSIKSLMHEVRNNKKFTIQVIVGASAVLKKFGNVSNEIKKDGFRINSFLEFQSSSLLLETMSSTVGNGLLKISESLKSLKPDFVFTVGDRYETMATALATVYQNIPLCHTMGGERTGTIDESIRHAISKLSHFHFVANNDSKNRLIKMGENKKYIFNVGCPRIDIVKNTLKKYSKKNLISALNRIGVGVKLNLDDKLIIFSQHPVTSEYKYSKNYFSETLQAINKIDKKYKIIYLWPNSDPGSDEIAGKIRLMREREKFSMSNFRFITNLSPELYFQLMRESKVIVGNSSSAIREGAFIGTPAVDIGTRQSTRLKAKNVIMVNYDTKKIHKAIIKQLGQKFKKSNLYGNGNASKRIVKILSKIDKVDIQKLNTY